MSKGGKTMSKGRKCECDEEGVLKKELAPLYDIENELPYVNHKPNKCKCKNDLKQYIRNGKKIWLCSCCCLSTDKEVQKEERE